MTNMYGEDAELISDEEVERMAEADLFLMAKHILRTHSEDDPDAPRAEIDDIWDQLNDYTGDDFEEYFDLLMHEHTEDVGGLMSYPNGYLFQFYDMVVPFSAACLALEPGQLSDVVESEFGYHIILRLPVDYDEIPIADANRGYYRSLRQLVIDDEFDLLVQDWLEELVIKYTDAYNSMDISELFVWND